MTVDHNSERIETDQHLAALINNSSAIRALTQTVAGTLGPKGLDCMLIDQDGGVIVTNDGATILKAMDVTHPIARVLINAAQLQEEIVGDGTTTATILAGGLITEGVNQVLKGVPTIKVIDGIRLGIEAALRILAEGKTLINQLDSPILEQIALIAARGHQDLADLVVESARILGGEFLTKPGFRLADQILAFEGISTELIRGTIINRDPLNRGMPRRLAEGKIVILDDALEPVKVDHQALGTETGFNRQLQNQDLMQESIRQLAKLGVKGIFADRAISDEAESLLTDLGLIAVQGVARREWERLAMLTGARPIKRDSLFKPPGELGLMFGQAAEVIVDEEFKNIRVLGYPEQKMVTLLIGAYTKEVVEERERIAKDTAGAVQAAWSGGVVPGGGSVELWIARLLKDNKLQGMACYGYECVIEALKKPIAQICSNAGFNPLEKLVDVLARQEETGSPGNGVNCETGMVEDFRQNGVWDPYLVKYHALKLAGEVAEAILRINTIIKMKDEISKC